MKFKNIIKTSSEYNIYKKAGETSALILNELKKNVKENVSAFEIDQLAWELCSKYKVKPSFLNVPGVKSDYPSNLCISINNEILHAIPHKSKIFRNGDIIKLDFGIIYEGFFTDHCITIGLGNLSSRETALINTSKLCVDNAINQAIVGNNVVDISNALQTVAELSKFNYIKTYCGHGIWKGLHYPPEIPSYVYNNSKKIPLVEGLVLCVENQIVIGKADLYLDSDGWTLKTQDGSKGAMFEHTIIVRKNKPEILTLLPE